VDHVRSGIAVGHRIHVERVDLIDRALETIGGGFEDAQQRLAITLRRDGRDSTIEVQSPEEIPLMPRACAICGKTAAFGSNVSHSKVHTHRRFDANLHSALINGEKLLVCTRCRRDQTKNARMARKRERAKAR
jgi:ribosomal protein L28